MNNKQILETLHVIPLSDEEKSKRHILARLYGPIATFGDSTRNGRYYNKQLWEKALSDEIFLEKVANKSLFLELEHPVDRDTIDMKLACACIPEVPKIIGDDLYAVIDILDTPNGKLLKTFIDYGFVPGISSRGSGDVDANNEVDPETFFLETWDIVSLPAVKKARLNVCESFDPKQQKLQHALLEAYNASSDEDKKIMKTTLENLNVNLTESPVTKEINGAKCIFANNIDDVPEDTDFEFESLVKEDLEVTLYVYDKDGNELTRIGSDPKEALDYLKNNKEASRVTYTNTSGGDEYDYAFKDKDGKIKLHTFINSKDEYDYIGESLTEADDEIESEEDNSETSDVEDTQTGEAEDAENAEKGEAEETETEDKDENEDGEAEFEPKNEFTVKEITDAFKGLNKDAVVKVLPVEIDNKEMNINLYFDKTDEDNLVIGGNIVPVEDDENIEAENSDDETPVDENTEDSAEDDGDEEVIESLKEAIRQKDLLENEVKNLRSSKTVSDAKVVELNEGLIKYKNAFERTSELAAKAKALNAENKTLNEQLSQKDNEIKSLSEQVQKAKTLNESMNSQTAKVKTLTEKLNVMQKEFDTEKTKLNEQLAQYKKGYADRTALAKDYKNKFNTVLTRYIESKAQMLGVRPADITCKLNENYTIDDVDNTCQAILEGSIRINRIPVVKNAKIRINESVNTNNTFKSDDEGYEIDDTLLELAGLK